MIYKATPNLEVRLRRQSDGIENRVLEKTLEFLEYLRDECPGRTGIIIILGYEGKRDGERIMPLGYNKVIRPCTIFDDEGQRILHKVAEQNDDGAVAISGQGDLRYTSIHFRYNMKQYLLDQKLIPVKLTKEQEQRIADTMDPEEETIFHSVDGTELLIQYPLGIVMGFGHPVGTRHEAAKSGSYYMIGPKIIILSQQRNHIRIFQDGLNVAIDNQNPDAEYEYQWDTDHPRILTRKRSIIIPKGIEHRVRQAARMVGMGRS
jgi:hypothetical protein